MMLDPQRILFIGMPSGALPVRVSKFFDTFNVNNFHLVAWNAKTFIDETQERTGQSLQSYHHPFVYRRFKASYEAKISQILDWVRSGHVFVIFPHMFSVEIKTDGSKGVANININQFPPFSLIDFIKINETSLVVTDKFYSQFNAFVDILRCNLVFSAKDSVPLFLSAEARRDESSTIAGAAFPVGKGAIVFSPSPRAWNNPKLLKYLEALAKLPDMLSQPSDLFPERASVWQGLTLLLLAALPALLIATIALSPFWAPHMERLLPWGGKPQAAGQDYATLAARLTEIEKLSASSSFDIEAIKSAESALARRVDRLETAVSRLQELAASPLSNDPANSMPPTESSSLATEQPAAPVPRGTPPHLSTQEIAQLLGRGDTLLLRGDVASARLFYARAADAGDGRAALRMGGTFDPALVGQGVLRGVRGDPAEARLWYQRARNLNDPEAEGRLKSFETR
jgi:hypothetical protein